MGETKGGGFVEGGNPKGFSGPCEGGPFNRGVLGGSLKGGEGP